MSRPLLLVSLILLLVFTSQFEWNQLIVNEVEARPLVLSQKQQYIIEREESVKEKASPLPELCVAADCECAHYDIDLTASAFKIHASLRPKIRLCELPNLDSRYVNIFNIILSQEKQIHKLEKLVQSLQEQLQVCKGKDDFVNDTTGSLTELLNELNDRQIME
ncbi:hypothetical protein E3N88_14611 [Mikania micrantha]|uniref:Bifunctional inhibitor/plant lipid transfer protein/seed storage helical domain-containing protein n=1 Tax=Mikania micrantha TaxID=192012 RepID=A0A5N6P3M2_9ASTR|nr:hypothetical protein E3N88_14611 [Mikania micrantha]